MKKQYIGRSIALLLSFLLILCCGPITAFGQAPQNTSQIVQSNQIEQSSLPEQTSLPEQESEPVENNQAIQESHPAYSQTPGAAANDIQARDISGPNTVEVGDSITLNGTSDWVWNHNWSYSSNDGGKVDISVDSWDGSTATISGVSAGTVTITHTYSYGLGWTGSETFTVNITAPQGNFIEAKVYLRYSNAIPQDINNDFGASEFGPGGDDSTYITVTVDLDKVDELTEAYRTGNWIYYSIDSDRDWNQGNLTRKEKVTRFWEQVIYPAIEENDRQALDEIFGGHGNFIGYVLKKENVGWHIDGILAEDPPIYVVELYDIDQGERCVFTLSSNNEQRPGVSYSDFEDRLEEYLGGTDYTYIAKETDFIQVEYTKNGVRCVTTVTPFEGDGYGSQYHVYPGTWQNKFAYRQVTANVYYISRMQIETEVYSSLSISKTVTGNAANVNEHFNFTLSCSALKNNTYNVTYTGTEGCDTNHASTIKFDYRGQASITLKHGETAYIQDIPSDITITVTESEQNNANNYTAKVSVNGAQQRQGKQAEVHIQGQNNVAFENSIAAPVPTGIVMDILPYIVLAAVVLAGVITLVIVHFKRKGPHNKDIWDE